MERPKTPPAATARTTRSASRRAASPPTPEVTRRIEENRLRAKALRDQHEAAARAAGVPSVSRTPSGFIASDEPLIAGKNPRKRTALEREASSGRVADTPATSRDGRANGVAGDDGVGSKEGGGGGGGGESTKDGRDGDTKKNNNNDTSIRPARKFTKFVDYDFGKMTDTKGGFLAAEDDPWNKAMSGVFASSSSTGAGGQQQLQQPGHQQQGGGAGSEQQQQRPQGMSVSEWERLQLLRKLRRQKSGPFEPGISVLAEEKDRARCRECGSLEVDFVWVEVFSAAVCSACKAAHPDKYSLLTKTECREDYLLTEPELRDPDLLPHLSRPNPHKSHWHDMMLFLRFQVEDYAFGDKRWGSAEALDAEFARREAEKKARKEKKFREKLLDLKKRTRTDAYRRERGRGLTAGPIGGGAAYDEDEDGAAGGTGSNSGGGGKKKKKMARFGDAVPGQGKHVHEWGRAVENEEGMSVKTCVGCGMEVEELEL